MTFCFPFYLLFIFTMELGKCWFRGKLFLERMNIPDCIMLSCSVVKNVDPQIKEDCKKKKEWKVSSCSPALVKIWIDEIDDVLSFCGHHQARHRDVDVALHPKGKVARVFLSLNAPGLQVLIQITVCTRYLSAQFQSKVLSHEMDLVLNGELVV